MLNNSSRALMAFTTLFSIGAMAGNSIRDTHTFNLGFASQDADIKATSSLDPLPPIEIDLTDDLGMDDNSDSIYASYRWRFAEKWSLSATYQRLDLDGSGAATKDFNFDGEDFSAGIAIDSEFNMDTYRVDVGYSFIRNDNWEVLVGAGLHAFDIETVITGRLEIESDLGDVVREAKSKSTDFLAPLPNLRGAVTYMISPNWEVNAGIGWLSLEIDNIDGDYRYGEIGTEYRFTDQFGIGANYQISEIDVTSVERDGFDEVDVEFSGPSIYLTYGF
jgi:hypothetical protein